MSPILKKFAALGCALLMFTVSGSALAEEAEAPEISPLAAGYLHSAIVKEDGTLWVAGSNSHGQLGNGKAGPQEESSPEPAGESAPASEVSGEAASGEVSSEEESSGVLSSTEFVEVMQNARSVYAGYLNTFAINGDGVLYGWGWNEGGQLGLGDTDNRTTPCEILPDVVFAAPGQYHTAAVTGDGTLWTWGWNDSGQLGNGTTESMSTPREALTGVRSVSLGIKHTMAVKTDNTLWAVGDNSYGQLADGTTESSQTFRQVMDQVQSVSCSTFGTLILKTDGTLWACGYNSNGQLGNGTYDNIPEPVQILSNVRTMNCGYLFSAAITKDDALYAWGDNSYGQYGLESSSTPIEVAQGVTDVAISANGGHMLYLLEDGTVQAMGNNEMGQLGSGSLENLNAPASVAESVSPTPRTAKENHWPEIILAAVLVLAVAALFAYLIVRTLRGGKPKNKQPKEKREKAPKEEKPKRLSDQELIHLVETMTSKDGPEPDVENLPDEITKEEE